MGETKKRVTRRGPRPDDPGGVPVPPPAGPDQPDVPAAGTIPAAGGPHPDRAAGSAGSPQNAIAEMKHIAAEMGRVAVTQSELTARIGRTIDKEEEIQDKQVEILAGVNKTLVKQDQIRNAIEKFADQMTLLAEQWEANDRTLRDLRDQLPRQGARSRELTGGLPATPPRDGTNGSTPAA